MAEVLKEKRKGYGISRKCASLVKEQRSRLYILRRCATMLLCWYIQGDDWTQILETSLPVSFFPYHILHLWSLLSILFLLFNLGYVTIISLCPPLFWARLDTRLKVVATSSGSASECITFSFSYFLTGIQTCSSFWPVGEIQWIFVGRRFLSTPRGWFYQKKWNDLCGAGRELIN